MSLTRPFLLVPVLFRTALPCSGAWKNTDTAIVGDRWTGVGETPRLLLLTGAKKSHLGCLISFQLPMGFQNFVVINKIHPVVGGTVGVGGN